MISIIVFLSLTGCGNAPKETTVMDPELEKVEQIKKEFEERAGDESTELSQEAKEKLAKDIQEKSVEYDYLQLFRNEVAEGEYVKFTGEAFAIKKEGVLGGFILETNLETTKGLVEVIDLTLDESIKIEVGQTYTVYGMFVGKEEGKAPQIGALVIEKLE